MVIEDNNFNMEGDLDFSCPYVTKGCEKLEEPGIKSKIETMCQTSRHSCCSEFRKNKGLNVDIGYVDVEKYISTTGDQIRKEK